MIQEYVRHNLFRESLKKFSNEDPQLSVLKEIKYVHPMNWWSGIEWNKPGIYILTGGRQIGKTTSTKLLIKDVLTRKLFSPQRTFYLPCDQIDDHRHLSRIIRFFFEELEQEHDPFLLIIDEVTFVREWDRAIKALADEGWFRKGFCIITGSDSVILKEAASRFPGRRGEADVVDYHLHPLSFHDYVDLVDSSCIKKPSSYIDILFQHFDEYLHCGGYLRAINDYHAKGHVSKATYAVFEQWIIGDFEKRRKNVDYLARILQTLTVTGLSQTTYSSLTQQLALVSKDTLIQYCSLLERMDILFTLQAFDQNKRRGFPKKARKFHFSDPFITDTISQWLIKLRYLDERDTVSVKVESIVAEHMRRITPTYYIKADGEIDVVSVEGKRFLPLEVKWTQQLRPGDLKQLKKYPNGQILTKQRSQGTVQGIPAIPVPLFLIEHFSN